MSEYDPYDRIHEIQIPKIQAMEEGEVLLYYLTRRITGADSSNTGPCNLLNIIVNDRLEELGLPVMAELSTSSENDIRTLAETFFHSPA